MWYTSNHIRTPSEGGEAALLGTTCHEALEMFIQEGYHLPDPGRMISTGELLSDLFETAYHNNFPHDGMFATGRKMLMNWLQRSGPDYWEGRQVMSAEVKESFALVLGRDPLLTVPFNFIWDRCDKIHAYQDQVDRYTYDIEVIDYKSWIQPRSVDEVRRMTQTQAYALAAHLKYPEAENIWVTMDMLRYDQASVRFTREECEAALRKFTRMAIKIEEGLAAVAITDGTNEDILQYFPETLGDGCRYCPRKAVCDTLNKTTESRGVLATGDVDKIARAAWEARFRLKGVQAQVDELENWLRTEARNNDVTALKTDSYDINFKLKSRRKVDDHEGLARVLGADIMVREGTLTLAKLDALLKGSELTESQKSQIKGLIGRDWSDAPQVEINPVHVVDAS